MEYMKKEGMEGKKELKERKGGKEGSKKEDHSNVAVSPSCTFRSAYPRILDYCNSLLLVFFT